MTEQLRRTWRFAPLWIKWCVLAVLLAGLGVGLASALDTDNDGINDDFEAFFGLNPFANDASQNPDDDWSDNLTESLSWSDPFALDTDRDGFMDGTDSNPVSRAYIQWGAPFFTHTNDVVYTWPDWMVAAFKTGGHWNTSAPAWWVSSSETGLAAINMEVDRRLLTNDLRMTVSLAAGLNASLFMDLYDDHETVVVSNLGNNLVADVGTGAVKNLLVSLSSYTNAVGIRLRRESGEVTVGETLLFVDVDGDGLDADQEAQIGTSDLVADSDGDGSSDWEEVWNATNPLDSASHVLAPETGDSDQGVTLIDQDLFSRDNLMLDGDLFMLGDEDWSMMAESGFGGSGATRKMEIVFAGYTVTETLTNFPVLLVLSNNVGGSGLSYADFAATNGIDLRFTDQSETNELSYEIETWNTNAASYVWVQVPVLTNNTSIFAYWGDTDLAGSPAVYTTNGATWAQGFARVWHMNGGANDSTSNRVNGTRSSVTNEAGWISGAQRFTSNSYMSASSSGLNGSAGTVTLFARQNNSQCYPSTYIQYLFANPYPTDRLYLLTSNTSVKAICKTSNTPGEFAIGTGTWTHIALTWTSSNSMLLCDGVLVGTSVVNAAISWQPSVYVGSFGSGRKDGFQGAIDEARISTVVRSTNWARAEWLCVASNAILNAFGQVEILTNGPPTVTMEVTPSSNPVTGTNVLVSVLADDDSGETNLTYSWSAVGPSSVTFTLNGGNSAKDTTATFTKTGEYWLVATIMDQEWASVMSSGSVTVAQTASGLTVSPANATLWKGAEQTFSANVVDQFGDFMGLSTSVTWSANAGGTIGSDGIFTATNVGGPFAVAALAGGCSATATVSVLTAPAAWMGISVAGYTRAEPLTNFPLLVVFSNNVGNSGFSYAVFASTNGYDLRFSSAELTNELPYEVEKWDASGTSYVWVRVPVLTSNVNLWARWGDTNLAAVPPAYTTNGTTWAQGFARVWHMNGGANDSTSNRVNGTLSDVTSVTGLMAGAQRFTDTSDMSASSSRFNSSAGTVTLCIRQDDSECSYASDQCLFINPDPFNRLYLVAAHTNLKARCKTDNTVMPQQASWTTGTWNHVALSWTASNFKLWHNGDLVGTGVVNSAISWKPSVYIGAYGQFRDDGFRGIIDETRVSTVVRSTNWVWAEWMNIASNSSFLTYDTASSVSPSILVTGSTNVTALHATLLGQVVSAGATPSDVYAFWGTNSANWSSLTNLGIQGVGSVGVPVSGLWPERTYAFTFMMSNASEVVWAPSNGVFTTSATASSNDIPTDWQMAYFGQTGIDPNADPDGDGMTNLWEYLRGTNPTNADTDGDSVPDETEIQQGRDPTRGAVSDVTGQVQLDVYTPLE